jgi:arylsulfatase A-like enzyme
MARLGRRAAGAALALAFAEALVGLGGGERLPLAVLLSVYALEAALGLLFLTATLAALAALAPLRPLVLADDARGELLALLLPAAATGALWLYDQGHLDDPQHALLPALAWLAAVAAVWLVAARPLRGAAGPGPGAIRQHLALLAPLASLPWLQSEGLPLLDPGSPLRPALFLVLSALAAVVALAVSPRIAPRPRPMSVRLATALLPALLLVLAWGLVAAVDAAGDAPAPPGPAPGRTDLPPDRPSVVLVSIDTLRADHVGAHGYRRDTTPALDRLARDGTRFAQALSVAPWTLPAHSALLASRWPGELAGYRVAGTPTLATLLHDAGYRTVAFTGGYLMARDLFGDGFDLYHDDLEDAWRLGLSPVFLRGALVSRQGLRRLGLRLDLLNPLNGWRLAASAWGGAIGDYRGPGASARAAARWLRDHGRERPFLLFFHTFGVHDYFRNVAPDRARAGAWLPGYRGPLAGNNLDYGQRLPGGDDLAFLVALYDGAVRSTDDAVGELLDALRAAGLEDRTLVVVTSDHGEGLEPERDRTWHRRRLHDDLLRVPLLVRFPGRVPAGRVVHEQVSLVDVLPTLLDLLGLDPAPGARGRSLRPLLAGPPSGSIGPVPAFADTAEPAERWQAVAVRTSDFKLIRKTAGGGELYRLGDDPGETRNLLATAGPELGPLDRLLDGFRARLDGGGADVDAATRERMRSLGYLD